MGFSLFGGFGRKESEKNKKEREENGNNSTIAKFSPKSYDEVASIIDLLASGEPAIVSLSSVGDATAQRVIDLLSGATYAIGGNLSKLDNDLYVFTPSGVKTKKN